MQFITVLFLSLVLLIVLGLGVYIVTHRNQFNKKLYSLLLFVVVLCLLCYIIVVVTAIKTL